MYQGPVLAGGRWDECRESGPRQYEGLTKRTRQSATQKLKSFTYFGWSGVRFGQVGGAGSAGPEVVAAAVAAVLDAAVLDAAAGPRAVVAAAVGLPAVAAGISAAAAAE